MAPPPPMPSMPATSGPQASLPSQSSTLPQSDLFAELLRLGLNPEDLAKQSSIRPQVREEVVKNLQAILGKKDSADLLRKLMPLRNEWPTTTTTNTLTPPDYQRNNNGPIGSGSGSKDNILGGSILSGAGGGTGGTMSFTDHINNGNSSQQQEQDAQYASAQQQHLRQAVASSVNHHQHFRIPATSSTMHNSPLQQQQQQMLSQHKSVLSLHHQHHLTHPHQADQTHRQRQSQQHKLNSLPNSSITNLNDIKAGSSSSISSSNPALLDAKSVNIFNHRSSPAISPYTLPAAGSTPRVPSIMDAINGQSSLDNMHDNTPLHQQITMNNRDKLKSMARHQQLQKQFKTNAERHKNLQWPNQTGSTSNLNLGSEPQNTQRIIGSNNSTGSINHVGLSQLQRQLTSPISTAISPPQSTPGLPKSLLNLAACSSSPPYASNANQMSSNSRSQISNLRSANSNQFGNLTIPANNRAVARNDFDTAPNQKVAPISDPTSLLHQMMKSSSSNKNLSVNSNSRSNYSSFSLSSLLSDDQSKSNINPSSNRSSSNQATTSLSTYQAGQPIQRRPSSAKSDESSLLPNSNNYKDPYAMYLRERTAKAGISIGKTALARDNIDQPSRLQNVLMAQTQAIDPLDEAQGEIDPAMSRLDARNDLSLLYPPVSLASNSQRQINSLSAGMQIPGEQDQFTDEIKKIVQEDCNIIYECKTCSNLFRSLANLVKHKRLYCKEDRDKTIQLELNRRSNINAMSTLDMSVTKSSKDNTFSRQVMNRDGDESDTSFMVDGQPKMLDEHPASNGSQKYNLRGKRVDVSFLVGNSRSNRSSKNQDRFKDAGSQQSPTTRNYADNLESNSGQTYLSRLLQSQPRNRVSPMKDSALMGALSVAPAMPTNRSMIADNSIRKLNEQLVRNSSLAKTLLSENVKSISINQSNSSMMNSENHGIRKSPAPKRKLLEDCISKVKRDRMGPSESASCDSTLVESHLSPMAISQDESEPYRDPLEINDSGADSDALVMDIDSGNTEGDNEFGNKSNDQEATNDKESNDGEDKDVDAEDNITSEQDAGVGDTETNTNDMSNSDAVNDEADTQDAVIKTEATSGVSDRSECEDEIKIDDDDQSNQVNNGEQESEEEVQEEEDDGHDDDDDDDDDDEDDEDDGDDGSDGDNEDNEEDNDEGDEEEEEDGDCDDSDTGESNTAIISTIKSERKSSYCSSTRSESDPNSSDIRDKNPKHKYYDNSLSHTSSKSSSKSSTVNTLDGTGGCKLILKTALAGSSRDGGSGCGSGASTSSGGPGSSSGGSGGSIMKVKIQLKTQPDEKSKVYRIVE